MKPKKTVLIIDDNKEICELTKLFLEPLGVEIYIATNKNEAVGHIENFSQNKGSFEQLLILLDKSLHNFSITDLKETLDHNDIHPYPPIIAFTAADKDQKQVHVDEGYTDVLSKPFTPEDLEKIVSSYK